MSQFETDHRGCERDSPVHVRSLDGNTEIVSMSLGEKYPRVNRTFPFAAWMDGYGILVISPSHRVST